MSGCLAEALNMDVQMPHSNAMAPAALLTLLSCCAADGMQRPAGPVSQQLHALQQLLRHAVIVALITSVSICCVLYYSLATRLVAMCWKQQAQRFE
jgi:hypothetical protein